MDASGAKRFLRAELEREYDTFFGRPPANFLEEVATAWMADETNSKHRFDSIEQHLPGARRILDMASGCGTAVFYGLLHGYDMYGIDPEPWKHRFNALKAAELDYPPEWLTRFHDGLGERLPFPDDYFDCVTTYQTLEHVQDVEQSVSEMVRVTRAGGGIHIRCPDYSGTFEGHYRLPWLPLFPRPLAKLYLLALRRPPRGLDTIQYVTKRRLLRGLARLERRGPSLRLRILDLDERTPSRRFADFRRTLFRQEKNVNLFVLVLEK